MTEDQIAQSWIDRSAGYEACWPWRGTTNGHYGHLRMKGRAGKVKAHRWAYERVYGAIPEGWEVHHLCGNSLCCNPDHLTAMPRSEHRRLGAERKQYGADIHQAVCDLHDQGFSFTQISRQYGMRCYTASRIYRRLRSPGITEV